MITPLRRNLKNFDFFFQLNVERFSTEIHKSFARFWSNGSLEEILEVLCFSSHRIFYTVNHVAFVYPALASRVVPGQLILLKYCELKLKIIPICCTIGVASI